MSQKPPDSEPVVVDPRTLLDDEALDEFCAAVPGLTVEEYREQLGD